MSWFKERVWQMGIGILLLLLGAWLTYAGAAEEPVGMTSMWIGLALIFGGLLVPLLIKLFEAVQEAQGEEGEL